MSWQLSMSWQWEHWSQLNCQTPRPTHACDLLLHEKRTLAAISLKPKNEFYRDYSSVVTHHHYTHVCNSAGKDSVIVAFTDGSEADGKASSAVVGYQALCLLPKVVLRQHVFDRLDFPRRLT